MFYFIYETNTNDFNLYSFLIDQIQPVLDFRNLKSFPLFFNQSNRNGFKPNILLTLVTYTNLNYKPNINISRFVYTNILLANRKKIRTQTHKHYKIGSLGCSL